MTQRTPLEERRTPGYPVVKRTEIGQKFNGAILKVATRDRQKPGPDGTMEPMTKPNGSPRQELVVTCLTLPGTTAPVGLGEEEGVPQPGDVVRLILKGKAFADWIAAKKNLPDGTVAVGDVVTQTTTIAQAYDQNGKAVGDEITDQAKVAAARQKGRSVGVYGPLTLREPKAGSEWLAKATEAYKAMSEPVGRTVAEEPPDDPYPVDDGWSGDDEPPF